MKKLLFAATLVLGSIAMFSCTSSPSTSSESASESTTESTTSSVEEKAADYAKKITDAFLKGETEKAEQIQKECDEWAATLNEEDQAKAAQIGEEYGQKLEEEMKKQMAEQEAAAPSQE